MTEDILRAWQIDISGRAPRSSHPDAWQPVAHEITPGTIYRDAKVMVTAFPVHHHEMKDSFGFRFDTCDRSVVISGDTTPAPALIENARGCDVLVHEAYSMASYKRVSPDWQDFRRTHHTSSEELAAIAGEANPRVLLLYHCSNAGESRDDTAELLREVRSLYSGAVIAGRDLDVL
jgi:ribonuclease BN (tRNA processing enzyme)